MGTLRLVIGVFSVVAMVLGAGAATGQNYPSKTIRIITSAPGGAGDFTARVIAQGLTANLGQAVVENRGGNGLLMAELITKAPPDGYLLLSFGSDIWLAPFLEAHVPYDPLRDFAPITVAMRSPNIIVVHPALPAKSVRELIALAKVNPGQLNYASGGTGGAPHMAAELFKSMTGVKMQRIPYKGTGPALSDLFSGQVQLMFPAASSITPHVKSGRVRALAITTAQPSALAPGLPTASASGVPGFEAASLQVLFAPAGTPTAIINRLNQEIVKYLNQPDIKEKQFNAGVESIASSPEQLTATMKSEMARLGKVIKEAGIRAD